MITWYQKFQKLDFAYFDKILLEQIFASSGSFYPKKSRTIHVFIGV